MALSYNKGLPTLTFGQKARPAPNLFGKFLDYGTRAAKVIGSVMEGPVGYANAAAEFGGMVRDKLDGNL